MVYCAAVGCYNHLNKKNIYFRLPSDESLHRTCWVKLGGKTYQQIMIPFVFAMYILKISFNAIYWYVFFCQLIQTLSSFVSTMFLTLRALTVLKFFKEWRKFRCTGLLRGSKLEHFSGKNLACVT